MTVKSCCDRPCLVPDWARGLFGHRCTNCRIFRPANGDAPFKVPVR